MTRCPYCHQSATKRDGSDKHGRQRYACRPCRRDFTANSQSAFSGGQQQRLCIARAIALQPEVLLMDEPCSALDPRASAQIEELVRTLAQRFTVIIVTHHLQQARRVSDYAALLWPYEGQGRLVEAGPPEALFDDPQQAETRAYVRGVIG